MAAVKSNDHLGMVGKLATSVISVQEARKVLGRDVEALANLIYDIFKDQQANANVDYDQNSEGYKKEENRQ